MVEDSEPQLSAEEQALIEHFGEGPLEKLFGRIGTDLDAETAAAHATRPEVVASLSALYVATYSEAVSMYLLRAGEWSRAVDAQRIAVSAVEAAPEPAPLAASLRMAAYPVWISVVTRYLRELPDGHLYGSALAAGQRLAADARADGDEAALAEVLVRLGRLNVDPVVEERPVGEAFTASLARWKTRLAETGGSSEQAMPEPEELLDRGERYLEEALEHAHGAVEGRAAFATITALTGRTLLGQQVDDGRVREVIERALRTVDADQDPHLRVQLLQYLPLLGQAVPPEEIERITTPSIDERVRQMGARDAAMFVVTVASVLTELDPHRGLRLMQEARSLLTSTDERLLMTSLRLEGGLMFAAHPPLAPEELHEGDVDTTVSAALARAERESWDAADTACVLLSLATFARKNGRERDGLRLIERARAIAPHFAAGHAPAFDYLEGSILVDWATRVGNDQDLAGAIRISAVAMVKWLDLGGNDAALEGLLHVLAAVEQVRRGVAEPLLEHIAPIAHRLEAIPGETAATYLQRLWNLAILDVVKEMQEQPEASQHDLLLATWQLAKGWRYAGQLQGEAGYDWSSDESGLQSLNEIAEREAALRSTGSQREDPALIDEPALVQPYLERLESSTTENPELELANMQRGFDGHVQRVLTYSGVAATPLTLDDVRLALPDDTALLWLYIGEGPDGRVSLHTLLITQERLDAVGTFGLYEDTGERLGLPLGEGRADVHFNPVEAAAFTLRFGINKDPGLRDVARSAQEALDAVHEWLGPIPERLELLRQAGKRHLCIVPHGPLHFVPLHLAGPEGHRLGDDWAISYLPHVALLSRIGIRPKPGLMPAAAVGLGFADDDRGLAAIPEAPDEAVHLARLAGVDPILEHDATETAVRDALASSVIVHIATHGRQNTAAPAFHSLFVAPSDADDGRICSYELLSLDLRHLAIVTLSACETALGRFDSSDNLRGIPASLFLRGALSVVGTLWDVGSDPSRTFFNALYDALNEDKSRFEAFTQAQRITRDKHPQLRDWGPFYYMGDWR